MFFSISLQNGRLFYITCVILAVSDAIRTSLGPRGMDKMVRL